MTGTASNSNDNKPLTIDDIKKAVESLPKIKGYNCIVASRHVDQVYRMPAMSDCYLEMIVVPHEIFEKLRAEFGDRPSSEYPKAFEFPVYEKAPEPKSAIKWNVPA